MGASYTYSSARDDAPEEVPGGWSLSDPSNRRLDRGSSAGDVRHVFRLSTVATPSLKVSSRLASALLNGYKIGLIVFADSGEAQNIVARTDLNGDGVFGQTGPDRPVGVPRNSLRIPAFFSADMRLSRMFRVRESMSFEVFGEAANLFNIKSVSSYDAVLPASLVDPVTGLLRGPLPDFSSGAISWRPSRQVQLGLRLTF